MSELQARQDFQSRQSNLVPFPTDTTPVQDGIPELFTVKDIEARYSVSNKMARNYVKTVKDAYFGDLENLKRGQKFTQLMIDKIDEFKASGLSGVEWVAAIHDENDNKLLIEQQTEQPVEGELLPSLDAGILARYQPKESSSLPTTQQYFSASDYQARYSGASNQLAKQEASEINFANQLLSQFADFAEDSEAWEKAEAQKRQARERQAATEGMSQALTEFMQKNTAYRAMLDKLESGEVTPQQVADFLARMQKQNPENA